MQRKSAKRSTKTVKSLKTKGLTAKQAKSVKGGAFTVKQKFDTHGLACDGGSKDPAY